MDKSDEAIKHNAAAFSERGPALSYAYQTIAIAHDGRGRVLVGGLGAMGVGSMWIRKRPDVDLSEAQLVEDVDECRAMAMGYDDLP